MSGLLPASGGCGLGAVGWVGVGRCFTLRKYNDSLSASIRSCVGGNEEFSENLADGEKRGSWGIGEVLAIPASGGRAGGANLRTRLQRN